MRVGSISASINAASGLSRSMIRRISEYPFQCAPVERERKLELRADAVGPGNQNRLAVLLRDLHKRAEAADPGQDLGAQGAPGERLDRLDERIARIDVDPRVAVGELV